MGKLGHKKGEREAASLAEKRTMGETRKVRLQNSGKRDEWEIDTEDGESTERRGLAMLSRCPSFPSSFLDEASFSGASSDQD